MLKNVKIKPTTLNITQKYSEDNMACCIVIRILNLNVKWHLYVVIEQIIYHHKIMCEMWEKKQE